jgi:hypothetical protein
MDHAPLDQLARLLAHDRSRRTVGKALAAGVLSGGWLLEHGRSSRARGRSTHFAQCLESCLRLCEQERTCRLTERDCAASCSNAEL